MNLSAAETRVLGCLLEKQRTTPDAYPLSLNALRQACNQATNRDPVVDYNESTIRDAMHRLERRGLARLASGRGSRAMKYRHMLADALPLGAEEQALVCVLMLRGAQTPGELKQRAERMHRFADPEAVMAALARLCERGLAERLGRRPGQKEDRFAQLLEGERAGAGDGWREWASPAEAGARPVEVRAPATDTSATEDGPSTSALAELERRVARLERELADLRASEHAGGDSRLRA